MEVNTNTDNQIILSKAGELSYPKEVDEILKTLKQQGFRDFQIELKTCYERSRNINCYGKQGWRITYPAKEPYREPWHTWYFPKGIEDKSKAVEVEVEVLAPEKTTSAKVTTEATIVDVEVRTETQIKALPATQDSAA